MKGSIRITWRCPHQKEETTRTCRRSDCGGSYYYRVRYGKLESKVGKHAEKKEAETEAVKQLSRWISGTDSAPARPNYTVNDLMDAFLAECSKRVAEGTMEDITYTGYETHIRRYIQPILGTVRLSDLSHQRVKDFHRECREKNPRISGTYLQALNRTLSIAINFGARAKMWLDPVNPCKGHTYPKSRFKPKVWSTESMRLFWTAAKNDPYFAVYAACLFQGPRRGEALAMHTEVISDDWVWTVNKQIIVKKKVGAKLKSKLKTDLEGIEEKKLPLRPEMIEVVRGLIARRERLLQEAEANGYDFHVDPQHSFLMIDDRGQPFHPTIVTKHFKALCGVLGLPVIRVHDLRHTFITMLEESGAPKSILHAQAGHTPNSQVTQGYTHGSVERARAMFEQQSAAWGLLADEQQNELFG